MSAPFENRLSDLRDSLTGRALLGARGASYFLHEQVGEGGQGWAFRGACDDAAPRSVLVKVMKPASVTLESLSRFEREAHVLRELSEGEAPNRHIVRFFDHAVAYLTPPDSGELISLPFTVLEFVEGPTLADLLAEANGHGLPLALVRAVLCGVASALEAVHAKRIVHRDLKPSNVLLSEEGGGFVAKVTDFGLAKVVEVSLYRTVTIAGASLGYAPAEQFEEGNPRVGACTDIFAAAAIVYQMVSGAEAFPHRVGENPLMLLSRLIRTKPTPLARHGEALSPGLRAHRDVLAQLDVELGRALLPDPAKRHASIAEFHERVDALLSQAIAASATYHSAFSEAQ